MAVRSKTTSAQYVAARARDPTFEKLMDKYKNFTKVVSIHELILAYGNNSPSVSLEFLDRLSQKLHLNCGAASFLKKYPHIFRIVYDPKISKPCCKLTDAASEIMCEEARAISMSTPLVVDRLVRLLHLSSSRSLPLRALFKVWRELGLPDDFENSVIAENPDIFQLCDGNEPKTHTLKLVGPALEKNQFTAAVEGWRVSECCKEVASVDRTELKFSFKQEFPPGMRLTKDFKAKIKQWQVLPYVSPYEHIMERRKSKSASKELEKRGVAIVHEFLSLTVEKMVEVEKISHFRKWFEIDINIRDLFLDHPGIFYLSTKGHAHTVFLREAYERGRLIEPNPIYEARIKLLNLMLFGRRALSRNDARLRDADPGDEVQCQQNIGKRISEFENMDASLRHQDDEVEAEYVLDLNSVSRNLEIRPNAPYVLVLTHPIPSWSDNKFKLIGCYEETIGTCIAFSEECTPPPVQEDAEGSLANVRLEGCATISSDPAPTKQVKPIDSTAKMLKFRPFIETEPGEGASG